MIIFIIFSVIPGSGASVVTAPGRKPRGALSFLSWFQHCKELRRRAHSYVYVNDIDFRLTVRKSVARTKCRGFFAIRCNLVTLVNALFTTLGEMCAGRSPVSILYRIVHGSSDGG